MEQDIKNKDAAAVAKDLQAAVSTSGAQVMVMGGGNSVNKAYMTQVTGVGNTVNGKDSTYAEGTSTQYNFVDGFQNELTNGMHDYIIGSKNKVNGESVAQNQSNIIFGDNHKLTNQKNNVIIGSSDTADDETTASNIVAIGHNAKVSAEGGVAIGSNSAASTVAGKTGYDAQGKTHAATDVDYAAWVSTDAAVSVGGADHEMKYTDKDNKEQSKIVKSTRQITNLAAGTEDTDAVNVAQLKKLEGMKANIDASNIGKNIAVAPIYKDDNGTKVIDQKATKKAEDDARTANENAWGTAIGTGEVAKDNGQLVTGGKVYDALHGGLTDITIGKPGTAGKDGKDGSIGLVGPKGQDGKTTTIIKTETGAAGVNGKDGKDGITRIVYNDTEDPANKHTVATFDDGMKYAGDFGSTPEGNLVKVKLNHQLDIVGDINAGKNNGDKKVTKDDLSDGNIGVVATDTTYNENGTVNTNGKLTIKLAKDLKGLHSSTYTTTETTGESDQQKTTTYTTIINGKGLTITDGPSITKDGIDGGNKVVKNVGAGKVEADSQDAVTGNQLYTEQKARTDADNKLTSDLATETQARTEADTAINNKIGTLNQNGNYIQKDSSISSNLRTLDNKVKKNADHIAQNTNDIKNLKDSSSTISKEIETKAGKDTDKGKQVIKDTMKADMDKKANVDASNIETSKWADKLGTGKVAEGDKNLINGDTVHNAIHEAEGRNPVQSNGQTITIGSKDTATKIDVSGTGKDGQSTGRIITGVVTDVDDPNSAANVGYVAANTQQIYRDMNNAYSRLDTNINRAAAGSNALAALHPLDFDPADKASFAVGYGHYHNANAAAVGAFYQPNANTMVNMGISLGNGDPGFNAGVSFKIGKGSTYNGVSKAEMAQTIHDQAAEISTIKANDAAKDKRIDALEKENQEMKKQIQEILARLNG